MSSEGSVIGYFVEHVTLQLSVVQTIFQRFVWTQENLILKIEPRLLDHPLLDKWLFYNGESVVDVV